MQLQFIDSGGSDGVRKLEGRQRKLVRSYVMKGRNLNKTIRRGRCNQQKVALQKATRPEHTLSEKESPYQISHIPGRVGDEFSGFRFAFELEPYMKRALYNYLTSISEHIYPMQVCLPRNPTDDIWFLYTLEEPAYLHCLLALSIGMIGSSSLHPQTAQSDALFHHGEALRLSNETLKCFRQKRLSDSLFAVITSLAIADSGEGNIHRARVHLDGLQCMLDHVGGFSYLNEKPSLQLKMLRLDVEFSVRTKNRPRFYYDAIDSPSATISFNRQPSPYSDLHSTFNYLNEFTTIFRNQVSNPVYLHPNIFHATISSLNYRLLIVPPSRGLHEALRLSLLAFMTSWFGYGFRTRYELLGAQLRNALLCLGDLGVDKYPLVIWMTFVGSIAIFSDSEFHDISPIIVEKSRALDLKEWSDVQQVLIKFPWVTSLHENAGRRIWQKVLRAD